MASFIIKWSNLAFSNNGDGTFLIDELAPGGTVSFDIVLTVGACASGILINNTEITPPVFELALQKVLNSDTAGSDPFMDLSQRRAQSAVDY